MGEKEPLGVKRRSIFPEIKVPGDCKEELVKKLSYLRPVELVVVRDMCIEQRAIEEICKSYGRDEWQVLYLCRTAFAKLIRRDDNSPQLHHWLKRVYEIL